MQNKCNVLNLLGASSVSNFFRENCTLKILSINSNAFGDDGILLIIDGLRYNNTLTELWVEECEFSVQGTAILHAFITYNSLCHLIKLNSFPMHTM